MLYTRRTENSWKQWLDVDEIWRSLSNRPAAFDTILGTSLYVTILKVCSSQAACPWWDMDACSVQDWRRGGERPMHCIVYCAQGRCHLKRQRSTACRRQRRPLSSSSPNHFSRSAKHARPWLPAPHGKFLCLGLLCHTLIRLPTVLKEFAS